MEEQIEILRRIADRAIEANNDPNMKDILNHLHAEIGHTKYLWGHVWMS